MNHLLRTIFATAALAFSSLATAAAQNPVVVELFTSEGCSSCPPADAVLVELSHHNSADQTPVILLGEHVDYWNYIGWTDRFSSAQFSQRQSEYKRAFHLDSVYTPQMVIDGRAQFVGNDLSEVRRRIDEAAREVKPAHVELQWIGSNNLHISVAAPAALHAKLLLVVTEDGLNTAVGAGENGGRTLHHAAVVRELRSLGTIESNKFESTQAVSPHAGWNPAYLTVAILVQDPSTQKILGAASLPFAH
jgi:hypothetical protein